MKKLILFVLVILTLSSCGVVNELLTYNAIYNRPYYRPVFYSPPRYSQNLRSYKHYSKPSSHYKFKN
jgi:hypothetical protein